MAMPFFVPPTQTRKGAVTAVTPSSLLSPQLPGPHKPVNSGVTPLEFLFILHAPGKAISGVNIEGKPFF